jgi:hypothetical protein
LTIIDIPLAGAEFTVPPFDELTMLIFGIPGSGKTRLCAGSPGTLFLGTEPGQQFTRARVLPVRNWQHFRDIVVELSKFKSQGRTDTQTVAIDIIDNLYLFCREYICRQKNLAYPPANDFGRTWAEITNEWSTWMRALMDMVNVRFISHTTTREHEVTNANGLKEAVDIHVPTFAGNKAAQYLDGVVNAMGFMLKNREGKHCITFRQTATIAAKDRTDILSKLGDIVLPPNPDDGWQYLGKCYEHVAGELGFTIKSLRV